MKRRAKLFTLKLTARDSCSKPMFSMLAKPKKKRRNSRQVTLRMLLPTLQMSTTESWTTSDREFLAMSLWTQEALWKTQLPLFPRQISFAQRPPRPKRPWKKSRFKRASLMKGPPLPKSPMKEPLLRRSLCRMTSLRSSRTRSRWNKPKESNNSSSRWHQTNNMKS